MERKSNSKPADPTAILLAAGKGERFDGVKQLVELRDKPLIRWSMDSIAELDWANEPLLVLGYRAEDIKAEVDVDGFRVLENDRWEEGMSSSLKLGVRAAESDTSGYLFFLADMPLVPVPVVERVLEKGRSGASIAAPVHRGRRGFPVLFDRSWKEQLLEGTSGDRGARGVIGDNEDELSLVKSDEEGVVLDVDERADLEEAESYLKEGEKEIGV